VLHEIFHHLGRNGPFLAGFADAVQQLFPRELLMTSVALEDHPALVLDFLVGGEAVAAGNTLTAATNGRAFARSA